ncbi:hypothetical protein ACFC6U_12845 [Kitasatospora purpeofusca]|uniref:hypothetical protein n=1 Tax=Kitasatospora purpeofusca TaxID=67352 RepID=UPI0035E02861
MTAGTPSALEVGQPIGTGPVADPDDRTAGRSQQCFILGPTGEPRIELGPPTRPARAIALLAFETIVEPACTGLGIGPVRSDQISGTGEITEQVYQQVLAADLVIADVSGGSPDVMYGLGLRHATGKPVIHIGEAGQLPPQIAPFHTITFRCSPTGLAEARNELAEALSLVLREDSPALVPPCVNAPGVRLSTVTPSATAELSGRDSSGLVSRFTELAPGLEATSGYITAITALVVEIASAAERFGPDMRRAAREGSPMSVQLDFTKRLSSALSRPAAELEGSTEQFAEHLTEIDGIVQAALDLFERVPPTQWNEDDRDFLDQLTDIATAARQGAETLALLRTVMDVTIAVHRELRRPIRNIATAVARLGEALGVLRAWSRPATRPAV